MSRAHNTSTGSGPNPVHNVSSSTIHDNSGNVLNLSSQSAGLNLSTADIPQNATLKLSTKLSDNEARTAFSGDQVGIFFPLQSITTQSKISCIFTSKIFFRNYPVLKPGYRKALKRINRVIINQPHGNYRCMDNF